MGNPGSRFGCATTRSDCARTSSIAGDQGVACGAESLLGYAHELFFDQHVVGVVSRNGENRNAVTGEGVDRSEQHSSLREGEWTFELEATPADWEPRFAGRL